MALQSPELLAVKSFYLYTLTHVHCTEAQLHIHTYTNKCHACALEFPCCSKNFGIKLITLVLSCSHKQKVGK